MCRIETNGDAGKESSGCSEAVGGDAVSADAGTGLAEQCKRVRSR